MPQTRSGESGGQKLGSARKRLTAKLDLPIWANEPNIVREFAIRVLQPESTGTGVDKTLRSRYTTSRMDNEAGQPKPEQIKPNKKRSAVS